MSPTEPTRDAAQMPTTLFARLEAVAERTPDRVAVAHSGSVLTFAQLTARARDLADELTHAGVQPRDRVAVILPNGPDFVIAAFAVWRAGAVLLPLHIRFQEEEILRYIQDAGARTILSTQRMEPVVDSLMRRSVGVEHAWLVTAEIGAWRRRGPGALAAGRGGVAEVEPSWPALTQYSTGSTGHSKRVTRTHAQLLGEFDALVQVLGIGAPDRILGVAPFFHNYGLMNALICGTLSGATIHSMEDFFPRDVARLIESERITGFPGVPFMHQLLTDLRDRADFSSLRYVLSAGAPLAAATADGFRDAFAMPIRQLYGSTETGVITIEPADPGASTGPTVGFAIPGVAVRIVDDLGRELAREIEGQVAVTSRYAASSYDNLEGRGETYFVDDAFLPGDVGRIARDGRLVLSGRKRQFINVAGNKVDPADVEAVLRELAAVAEVVVVGVPDGAAGERIKAVLVTSSACTRMEVLAHCNTRLADFKRPRVIEFRTEIPKSPLGKILRKYLIEDPNEGTPRFVFDPRTGFAQQSAGPGGSGSLPDLSAVSPFLRALLVTDGTVTKILEAYFWEPIDVELLSHAQEVCEGAHPEIGVVRGASIVRRRVTLRGRITSSVYAFAETVMAIDGIAADLRRSLVDERKGIGELLRARHLETYRELVGIERRQAGEWSVHLGIEPDTAVIARRYTIQLDTRPAMLITEAFPVARFES